MALEKSKLKILFLHGWQSQVGGVKPTYLENQGHEVINPKLDDNDWDSALHTAQQNLTNLQPDVIVGSSRGGAIAMNLSQTNVPLVLLCPAWKRWGDVQLLQPNALILHSRRDDVVPFADSEALIRSSNLPLDTLIEVGTDHRLADEDSLAVMLWACQVLAAKETLPSLESDHEVCCDRESGNSSTPQEEASYLCDSCGEEIVIPLDVSDGASQTYIEDCPVCCHANVIHVVIDEQGNATISAELE